MKRTARVVAGIEILPGKSVADLRMTFYVGAGAHRVKARVALLDDGGRARREIDGMFAGLIPGFQDGDRVELTGDIRIEGEVEIDIKGGGH